MFLYVLSLEFGKYYVGKTKDLVRRGIEHRNGRGAEWTKTYPLVGLEHWFFGDETQEDLLTMMVMKRYGISNVRGGRWCSLTLSDSTIERLELEIGDIENFVFDNSCMLCRGNLLNSPCSLH